MRKKQTIIGNGNVIKLLVCFLTILGWVQAFGQIGDKSTLSDAIQKFDFVVEGTVKKVEKRIYEDLEHSFITIEVTKDFKQNAQTTTLNVRTFRDLNPIEVSRHRPKSTPQIKEGYQGIFYVTDIPDVNFDGVTYYLNRVSLYPNQVRYEENEYLRFYLEDNPSFEAYDVNGKTYQEFLYALSESQITFKVIAEIAIKKFEKFPR